MRSVPVELEGEAAVVAGLKRGEAASFDRAYEAFRPRVYGFLVRMSGRRDLAEDLLQETWMRLATKAHTLADDTRLGPWLFTVARNLWISHCRSALLDAERTGELGRGAETRSRATPFDEVAGNQTQARLERALAALPPSQREVLLLVAVERLEPSEAATVLAIKPEAVRQRLSRARAMLESLLSDMSDERARSGAS